MNKFSEAIIEKEIIQIYEEDDEVKLITYLNRNLKDQSIQNAQDLEKWFELAKCIKDTTPVSFETSLKQLGLMDIGILSIQEFNEYLSQNIQLTMEIYPFEILNYILEKGPNNSKDNKNEPKYNKKIDFKLLDCRKTKELPENAFKSNETLKAFLTDLCKTEVLTHICIVTTDTFNKEEQKLVPNIFQILRTLNKNYFSTLLGGYQVVLKEIEQRKVNIQLAKRRKPSIIDKIKSIFTK